MPITPSLDKSKLSEKRKPLVIISGPTASGKSTLAIDLATRLRGEIVSLDSVQVYRGFDIGSAKPSKEERARVPHHLIDAFAPQEIVSAELFVTKAEQAIAEIEHRAATPLIVGGTTMYLTALLHGLVRVPEVDVETAHALEARSTIELMEELTQLDPQSAIRIAPNDRMRILRALEICHVSGAPASQIRAAHAFAEERHRALILVPMWSREDLYARINQRTQQMLQRGLLEETRALVTQYGEALHPLRALGYAQCLKVLAGTLPESKLEEEISTMTRRYAKRQLTYLRNEPRKRGWQSVPPRVQEDMSEMCKDSAIILSRAELATRIEKALAEGLECTQVWFLDAAAQGL